MNLQSVMTKMRTVTIFLCVIFAFFSCRQTVIEYNEIYQVRYITMEFTDTHGPGDILLSNGEWVLARDINKLTKERLDATPAIGVLVYEKEGATNADPRIPVVVGLDIKKDVKYSSKNTNILSLKGDLATFDLSSGKDSLKQVKVAEGSNFKFSDYPLFEFAADYSVEYNGVTEKDWYIPSIKELNYAFIGKGAIEISIKKLNELDPVKYPTETLNCNAIYRSCNQHEPRNAWSLTWSDDPNGIESGEGSIRVNGKGAITLSGLHYCAMLMHEFEY